MRNCSAVSPGTGSPLVVSTVKYTATLDGRWTLASISVRCNREAQPSWASSATVYHSETRVIDSSQVRPERHTIDDARSAPGRQVIERREGDVERRPHVVRRGEAPLDA